MAGRSGASEGEDFEAFFYSLLPSVMRVALRLTGDWYVSEDVASEAFARAFARWRTVSGLAYRDAWVMRVACNLAIDVARRRGVGSGIVEGEVADPAETAVLRVSLAAALGGLPRSQREAVVLRYLADLPEAEVSEALGVAAGTVKSHLHRARVALRAQFGVDMEGV
jgi:RNA polymerase sigma-70 factor (sigma-E family)